MAIETEDEARDPLMDQQFPEGRIRIKIVGIGGAGTNAVDRLKLENLEQVHLAALNTDGQSLSSSPVNEKLLLGRGVTRGLSAGGEMDVGREAAESDAEMISKLFQGVDFVFILAGLGGGTGSGAAPVVARIASEQGALVMGFVTMPFSREGPRRIQQAEASLAEMRKICNAVISLPNDLLLQQIDENATVMEAFGIADNWINHGVRSIWSMIFQTGLINVDFASLKRALDTPGGKTLFGTGYGQGEDYVAKALRDLELCPLLHLPENRYLKRTDSLIVNITGGPDLTMSKVNEVMEYVAEKFSCKDSMVLGAVIDGSMSQSLRITVLGMTEINAALKKGFKPVPSASQPQKPAFNAHSRDMTSSTRWSKKKTASEQEEFSFPQEEDQRGVFEKTGPNYYDGEDLDVPTYLRRGIKIALQ